MPERFANARLIAAAPELVAALERARFLLAVLHNYCPPDDQCDIRDFGAASDALLARVRGDAA